MQTSLLLGIPPTLISCDAAVMSRFKSHPTSQKPSCLALDALRDLLALHAQSLNAFMVMVFNIWSLLFRFMKIHENPF